MHSVDCINILYSLASDSLWLNLRGIGDKRPAPLRMQNSSHSASLGRACQVKIHRTLLSGMKSALELLVRATSYQPQLRAPQGGSYVGMRAAWKKHLCPVNGISQQKVESDFRRTAATPIE